MFMPSHKSSILRKFLIAGTSLLVVAGVGMSSAFAKDSKSASEKADSSAAASDGSEWTSYETGLEEEILGKWFPPTGQEVYKAVKVEMRIRKDGHLSKADIVKSSQIADVDAAARKAVTDAAPFKAFPQGVKKEDFAKFQINFDKSDIDLKRKIIKKV
jgi:TonB family protein